MAGQKVTIAGTITNEDGSEFADITINYHNVPRDKVLVIEEKLIAMQSALHEYGKQALTK